MTALETQRLSRWWHTLILEKRLSAQDERIAEQERHLFQVSEQLKSAIADPVTAQIMATQAQTQSVLSEKATQKAEGLLEEARREIASLKREFHPTETLLVAKKYHVTSRS